MSGSSAPRRMYGGETGVPVYVNNYGKEDHGPGRAGQVGDGELTQ